MSFLKGTSLFVWPLPGLLTHSEQNSEALPWLIRPPCSALAPSPSLCPTTFSLAQLAPARLLFCYCLNTASWLPPSYFCTCRIICLKHCSLTYPNMAQSSWSLLKRYYLFFWLLCLKHPSFKLLFIPLGCFIFLQSIDHTLKSFCVSICFLICSLSFPLECLFGHGLCSLLHFQSRAHSGY